jgi:protein tyrosine phosphatase (PTP) superfamily phosphohydrolase (DUF442 family)
MCIALGLIGGAWYYRSRRERKRRHIVYALLLSAQLSITSIGIWAGYIQAIPNFHAVEEGKLYRAAQMDEKQLEHFITTYGIKTVINLRGENKGSPWYDTEVATVTRLGAEHHNVRISAKRVPDEATKARLIDLMKNAPGPVLVHCRAGADRAGLAASLYEYAVAGKPPEEANQQLSYFYGHFPWLTSRTHAMGEAFWQYVGAHPNVASAP